MDGGYFASTPQFPPDSQSDFFAPRADFLGINSHGVAVGSMTSCGRIHPFMYQNGVFTRLDPGQETTGFPVAINDNGVIVTRFGDSGRMWRDGVEVDLQGEAFAAPIALNAHDHVLVQHIRTAWLWVDGGSTPITHDDAIVTDLNDADQVVGYRLKPHPYVYPFLWQDGSTQVLPLLPGDIEGTARAINNAGIIVGSSRPPNGAPSRGVVWEDGVPRVFDPVTDCSPLDIDDAGVILARCDDGLALYEGGVFHHLMIQANGFSRLGPNGIVVGSKSLFTPTCFGGCCETAP